VRSGADLLNSDRPVALKIIDVSSEFSSPEQVATIMTETRNEVELIKIVSHHENIVKFYADYWATPYIILCFERCSVELFEYMNDKVTIDEWQCSKMISQLLAALAFVHAKQIIHRDIKAENVLLTSNMDVKLTDFGISCYFPPPGALLTEIVGTPGYMAPEMVRLATATPLKKGGTSLGYHKEVDIWSLGIMMFILLIGFPPFWDENLPRLLNSILKDEYSTKMVRFKQISDEAKALFDRVLVKDPAERISIEQFGQSAFCQIHLKMSREDFLKDTDVIGDFDRKSIVECSNPYNLQIMREIIDTASFNIFKHWITNDNDKKNRASLYHTDPNLTP